MRNFALWRIKVISGCKTAPKSYWLAKLIVWRLQGNGRF